MLERNISQIETTQLMGVGFWLPVKGYLSRMTLPDEVRDAGETSIFRRAPNPESRRKRASLKIAKRRQLCWREPTKH